MLYPKYKIFMDMEIPFLFLNEDIFVANNAFFTGKGLNDIVEKYHPSFIIAPIERTGFKLLIAKHPAYKAIFFDETGVLYANSEQFPKIANEYELKEIDPYVINFVNIDVIVSGERYENVLKELSRLVEIYPGCGYTNQFMAILQNKKRNFSKSIQYTENIIKYYPESPVGYQLKADAFQGMEKYDDALLEYKKALSRAVKKVEIYREIGNIYMKQKKYAKAYKILKMITDPFSSTTDYKSMHDVCLAAILSGNRRDAEILFKYAHILVPTENKEWNEKYAKLADMLMVSK
jgi:tetratricopeptide (TPR) repeat protein